MRILAGQVADARAAAAPTPSATSESLRELNAPAALQMDGGFGGTEMGAAAVLEAAPTEVGARAHQHTSLTATLVTERGPAANGGAPTASAAAPPSGASPRNSAAIAAAAAVWPSRLLIADDDASNRKLLHRLLSRRYPFAAFDQAANGQEAVAAIEASLAA
jgi:CheY-like chemotaxis protein